LIDELQKEAREFETRISHSLKVMSPTNIRKNSFEMDNDISCEIKSFEGSYIFNGNSKIDLKLNRGLESINQLKSKIKSQCEEKGGLERKIEELTASNKLLTLENEVYVRERSFYSEQISKFNAKNAEIQAEYENRIEIQSSEYRKEIKALKEMLNQKHQLDDRNLERQQNIMRLSIESKSKRSVNNSVSSSQDKTLKKKVSLLEVS
jgi:hypothetical protein